MSSWTRARRAHAGGNVAEADAGVVSEEGGDRRVLVVVEVDVHVGRGGQDRRDGGHHDGGLVVGAEAGAHDEVGPLVHGARHPAAGYRDAFGQPQRLGVAGVGVGRALAPRRPVVPRDGAGSWTRTAPLLNAR